MNKRKWICWLLAEGITGVLIVAGCFYGLLDSRICYALWFFYIGFSLATILLIFYLLLGAGESSSARKAGRAWAGFVMKFIAVLAIIAAYLATRGFSSAGEGLAAIVLYIVFGWLSYVLTAKE